MKTLIQVIILVVIGHFVLLGSADFVMAWELNWDMMTWEKKERVGYICAQCLFVLMAWAGINSLPLAITPHWRYFLVYLKKERINDIKW